MDTVSTPEPIRDIVKRVLLYYTNIPYAYGDIVSEAAFDDERGRYLLVNVGWDDGKRVHGALVHIDVVDGKLWIQRDGLEHGIATDLMEAGIGRDKIVLAFKSVDARRRTEFAVA